MNIPILGRGLDERFLNHRLRSTSLAGIVSGVLSIGLFGYRYYVDGIWSWDLFAVAVTFVGVKLAVLACVCSPTNTTRRSPPSCSRIDSRNRKP